MQLADRSYGLPAPLFFTQLKLRTGGGAEKSPLFFRRFRLNLRVLTLKEAQAAYCGQCCGSRSGIQCLFDPWIWDGLKYFRELRNNFDLKYLNSLMRIQESFGPGSATLTHHVHNPAQMTLTYRKSFSDESIQFKKSSQYG
jgi:hypothetical protein